MQTRKRLELMFEINLRSMKRGKPGQSNWVCSKTRSLAAELFIVNELDVFDEGTELNAFIETTRWFGVKIRFSALNILDFSQTRDRTGYVGERDLSPVAFRELRTLTNGSRILLTLSGVF